MFTGIVEELGEVTGRDALADAARLIIRGPTVTGDAGHGDSIAVNGVCLTVETFGDREYTAYASGETLSRSNLGKHPNPCFTPPKRSMAGVGYKQVFCCSGATLGH